MALKATIIKANLSLSDMDKHVYQDINLTVAQHPSENDHRLMLRLLAFALQYRDSLKFTKGLCADDEPEAWCIDDIGDITFWLDLGLPDEKRIKKACNKAKQVVLYSYGENTQTMWWQKHQQQLKQYANLTVFSLAFDETSQLALFANKAVNLTITVQDGEVWVSNESTTVHLKPIQLM
ncbi:YaeQ family protein [Pseudoalteromonas sp. T1lg65]|uniref:YaeQ family protein n=1 Tax=Pseudoalteromonas sp. T1lg65 TaxID=2077101 RepID=UPI003F7914BD